MSRKHIVIKTEKQFTDLNEIAKDFVKDKQGEGMLNIFVRHTTCAIKILENEILLLADINGYLDKQFNNGHVYMHDKIEIRDVPINERVNGHSHMKQLSFPTSENIPVSKGQLLLGTWQTIFLIEFDPIREREIVLTYTNV